MNGGGWWGRGGLLPLVVKLAVSIVQPVGRLVGVGVVVDRGHQLQGMDQVLGLRVMSPIFKTQKSTSVTLSTSTEIRALKILYQIAKEFRLLNFPIDESHRNE